ncbi:hypothetical protein MP228_012215 [Amoeboaphelidium protococcarum]|nr:hypothetical protein MP228_012215 [Amoeboaphelidium protococcarum]
MSTVSDKGEFLDYLQLHLSRKRYKQLKRLLVGLCGLASEFLESKPVKKSVATNDSASEVDVKQHQTPQRKRSAESDESNNGAVTLQTPQSIVGKRQKKEITSDTELDGDTLGNENVRHLRKRSIQKFPPTPPKSTRSTPAKDEPFSCDECDDDDDDDNEEDCDLTDGGDVFSSDCTRDDNASLQLQVVKYGSSVVSGSQEKKYIPLAQRRKDNPQLSITAFELANEYNEIYPEIEQDPHPRNQYGFWNEQREQLQFHLRNGKNPRQIAPLLGRTQTAIVRQMAQIAIAEKRLFDQTIKSKLNLEDPERLQRLYDIQDLQEEENGKRAISQPFQNVFF